MGATNIIVPWIKCADGGKWCIAFYVACISRIERHQSNSGCFFPFKKNLARTEHRPMHFGFIMALARRAWIRYCATIYCFNSCVSSSAKYSLLLLARLMSRVSIVKTGDPLNAKLQFVFIANLIMSDAASAWLNLVRHKLVVDRQ